MNALNNLLFTLAIARWACSFSASKWRTDRISQSRFMGILALRVSPTSAAFEVVGICHHHRASQVSNLRVAASRRNEIERRARRVLSFGGVQLELTTCPSQYFDGNHTFFR